MIINNTIIYTDAAYSRKYKKGIICYQINGKLKSKKIKPPFIENLEQYSNLLELWAVKEALKKVKKQKRIKLFTDSQVIRWWILRGINDLNKFSPFHYELKREIDEIKKHFSYFEVCWLKRESNPAGLYLEKVAKQ